jgi:hypothetical protein
MNHKDWYSQRYSKSNSVITQNIQAKLDNYQQISEYNKQKKVDLVNEAIAYFTENSISYQVKTYNQWIVTLFSQNYYYYPKSGKFRPLSGKTTYYSKGAKDFVLKVSKYHASKYQ